VGVDRFTTLAEKISLLNTDADFFGVLTFFVPLITCLRNAEAQTSDYCINCTDCSFDSNYKTSVGHRKVTTVTNEIGSLLVTEDLLVTNGSEFYKNSTDPIEFRGFYRIPRIL